MEILGQEKAQRISKLRKMGVRVYKDHAIYKNPGDTNWAVKRVCPDGALAPVGRASDIEKAKELIDEFVG